MKVGSLTPTFGGSCPLRLTNGLLPGHLNRMEQVPAQPCLGQERRRPRRVYPGPLAAGLAHHGRGDSARHLF